MRTVYRALLAAATGLTDPAHALPQNVEADASAAAFVSWARDQAVPLSSCDAQSGSSTMQDLAPTVGEARVVALGEPAHGAREPLAFRNCLFRYLVEHHGFTAIAIESGLSESRRLNDYIAGGPGEARQLARDGLTWGFGRFPENAELIEWIRRYNADPARPRKIRFYGMDMSGGDSTGAWRDAPITLENSLAYLARVAPRRSRSVRRAVEPFRDRFTQPGYAALPRAGQASLRSSIDGLVRFFDRHRTRLIAASGEDDYDWARRNAILARQLEALFRVSRSASAGEALSPDDYKSDAVRDAAMADNVGWVLEREGSAGRVMVFAHNAHIVNAPTRGGIWAIYRHAPKAMGQYLRAALGDDLLILPISSPWAPPSPSASAQGAGTLDAALATTGIQHFLLDIRAVKQGAPASPWLAQRQSMRTNFETQTVMTPATAFDAVVFFARLTPYAPARER